MLILSNWLTGGVHLCLFYIIGKQEAFIYAYSI